MPSSEFRGSTKAKPESNQNDLFMQNTNFFELLYENGEIVMQGQQNQPNKSVFPTPFPDNNFKVQEKTGLFNRINELSHCVPVPAANMDDKDDDIVPWIDYPVEDPFGSEFFTELSGCGVTNFSNFARHVSLPRANLDQSNLVKSTKDISSTANSTNPVISEIRGNSDNNHLGKHIVTPRVDEKVPEAVVASSVCSGGHTDPKSTHKRKNRNGEESGYQSEELEDESVNAKKRSGARAGRSKRSRAAEVHNLSERRRRDRINEKMRALQELIPNCNKVDKASMLDEAIHYLKTLQLQVQMMAMGSGLCMSPMMLPPAMQHMHAPTLAHYSPMGIGMGMGMGMGMGYGIGMLDISASPIMHASQYPCTSIPVSSGLQFYGIPHAQHINPKVPYRKKKKHINPKVENESARSDSLKTGRKEVAHSISDNANTSSMETSFG